MKFTDLPDSNKGKWLQGGVHRVMIMSCKRGETKKGTPFVAVEFANPDDTVITITESMFASEGFPMARWKELYKAAYPDPEKFAALDIDSFLNADAHELLLVGRTIWISVDRWDDRYYWGVTAFYPDSTEQPPFVAAWKPKDADTRPPKEKRNKGANNPPDDFKIPPVQGREPGSDDDLFL